ncbi:long-chain fatty acid--CoA ligase [bacterium]|nr:MAG: long-chain fatty acid--CoA ligase [bacterium]
MTLGAMLRESVRKHSDRPAMLMPTGKNKFDTLTYAQLGERVREMAATVQALGLKRGDRLAIYSENSPEWAWLDWACQCLGVVVVPIYPTLPADQAAVILQDCGASLVVCGKEDLKAKVEGHSAMLFSELPKAAALSESAWNEQIDASGPEDLATIIYTSGTTGTPKGAMIPHRGPVHLCEAVARAIPIDETEIFLSFLPMSHVYERCAGQFLPIYLGACIAYAKSLASLAGDLVAVKPTVMLCVPRFLESFQGRVGEAMEKAPPLRQKLFRFAMSQGVKKARGQFAPLAGILDKFVMAKLRERTGGRMRYFVSGGAALAPSVAEFYMGCGLTVLQGYGLTETCGGTIVNRPGNNKYWTIGEPLETEAKLAEDGELLLRGKMVMQGYWHRAEDTAAAIDPEGWFHTGDIAEWEGKSLKITDRKKDLLVLGNGKNIAPQKIENELRTSSLITEAVVLGDGYDHCIALIVPNFERVRKELGLPDDAPLAKNPDAHKLVRAEVDRINKTMANFEAVKKFALLDDPFTVEGGELTPTLKVKRKVVRDRYRDILETLR